MTPQSEPRHCTCDPAEVIGHDPYCPWVRGEIEGQIVGHVKSCPVNGESCPCLPGSTSHAYCLAEVSQLAS